MAHAPLTLAVVLAIDLAVVLALWKELKLATFDPGLAAALGFAPGLLFHLLLGLTSATAVASFDIGGVVLFGAFAIVPPATAYLLTDRLGRMVGLAVALSLVASVLGHALAVAWDVPIGGIMACVSGAGFALALVFAPRRRLPHPGGPSVEPSQPTRGRRGEHRAGAARVFALVRGDGARHYPRGARRRPGAARGGAEARATLPRDGVTSAAAARG